MLPEIKISGAEIEAAEKILLQEGRTFDSERIDFITSFKTLDLQAVPGSGKTTALLAKLLILEKRLPFDDNRGILILSHTNAAIDEIKNKIGVHCPRLFSYPNFVGTIQSFVDQFLAVPYFLNKFQKKPYRIDNEIYSEVAQRKFKSPLKGFKLQDSKNAKYFLLHNKLLTEYRFSVVENKIQLMRDINSSKINIKRPKKKKWTDFSENEKLEIERWMTEFKLSILNDGVLHFDDAYFLAERYLTRFPKVKDIIQQRFLCAFVDEMQDMEKHQHDLLEHIFFDKGASKSVFQRIGDINQSIFSGGTVKDFTWEARSLKLPLNGSHRLTPQIAELVNCFTLFPEKGFALIGLRDGEIKPMLLVYTSEKIKDVLPFFSEKIHQYIEAGLIKQHSNSVYKAIGWVKEKEPNKIRIADYLDTFNPTKAKIQIDFSTLTGYLNNAVGQRKTFSSIRKSLLNALLKITRLECIVNAETKRSFSKKQLFTYLEANAPDEAKILHQNLFVWSFDLLKGQLQKVYINISEYIPDFLKIWDKKIELCQRFIEQANTGIAETIDIKRKDNVVNYHGFDIEVGTIHSAKGQTHTATLYLETFHEQGAGNYESERLSKQFNFVPFEEHKLSIVKQTLKMAYVGFSRPTDFLCVAVHKDRFEKYLQTLQTSKWDIKII